MDKYLLVALNSQYMHTNLAVRYIQGYLEAHGKFNSNNLEIYESNINNNLLKILKDILEKNATVILFSTYIWNSEIVYKLIKEIKKIRPETVIGMGGPEVSYNAEEVIEKTKEVDFIVKGEGERAVLRAFNSDSKNLRGIFSEIMPYDLDEIPFPYSEMDLQGENRILYYESSRGCPFSCTYCLSSIEKGVKYFSIDRVKKDLRIFLNSEIKLLKFVDRTFNINRERYMEIWSFLIDNYRSGITFHFEINANILDNHAIDLLKKVPEGYFQFEIGVQTVNWETMESINRRNLLENLAENIKKIPKTIHLHLDLIAGLPYETYNLFQNSFNYVYNLEPEMVQLGFLKILKGTKIALEAHAHGYIYTEFAPFEVLKNNYISFEEITRLKNIEKIVDYYYNSEKFKLSLNYFLKNYFDSPFKLFEALADYYTEKRYFEIGHKEITLFKNILDFHKEKISSDTSIFNEYLKYDLMSSGKVSTFPDWIVRNRDDEKYNELIKAKKFSSVREGHKMSDLELFSYNILGNSQGEIELFFDYRTAEIERL